MVGRGVGGGGEEAGENRPQRHARRQCDTHHHPVCPGGRPGGLNSQAALHRVGDATPERPLRPPALSAQLVGQVIAKKIFQIVTTHDSSTSVFNRSFNCVLARDSRISTAAGVMSSVSAISLLDRFS